MPGNDASAAHPHHPPQLSSRLGKLIALTPLLCSYGSYFLTYKKGFPGVSECKESACHGGDLSSVPGLGRFPGEGNSHPLKCSGLENSADRGACQVYGPWGHKELDSACKKQ